MSLFKLPMGLVEELNKLAAKFWWGSIGESRKIHWCKWENLCRSKVEGGMGFRNLAVFNQALLAKQCWRILQKPDSLAARVLKGCYFPRSTFMKAKENKKGSWIWKSLLWGRKLLNQGIRWRVGTGTEIFVYKDRWIPRPFSFKVVSPPLLGEFTLVRDLIKGENWNEELITQAFAPVDTEAILGLPLSTVGLKDKLIWHEDKWGNYTVKAGYKVGKMMLKEGSASSSKREDNGWKCFWKISIPSKVKILVWRAWHGWIPTAKNLFDHHVPINPLCEYCKKYLDSSFHALWGCSRLKEVRAECEFVKVMRDRKEGDFKTWLWECQRSLSKVNFELLCIILWRSWYMRNQTKFQNGAKQINRLKKEVVDWSRAFLADYQGTRERLKEGVDLTPGIKGWQKPSRGMFKINTDAAIQGEESSAGLGVIIRDANGKVLAACAKKVTGSFTPQIAELLAMLEGLKLLRNMGIPRTTLESNAKVLVDLINSSTVPDNEIGTLILEVQNLVKTCHVHSVIFGSRKGNQVAHSLAKLAIKDGGEAVWFDDCHVGVLDLIRMDENSIPSV